MAKSLDDLLYLGDARLYQVCDPVLQTELPLVKDWVADLDSVMQDFRKKYHFGRAIAAPQIGIMKRVVYMNIDQPRVFINPEFTNHSTEEFELWDDCMSFPNLMVRLKRYRSVTVRYLDERWSQVEWTMTDDLSELIQHEYDHLNGVLCTMRAMDEKSFKWRFP